MIITICQTIVLAFQSPLQSNSVFLSLTQVVSLARCWNGLTSHQQNNLFVKLFPCVTNTVLQVSI